MQVEAARQLLDLVLRHNQAGASAGSRSATRSYDALRQTTHDVHVDPPALRLHQHTRGHTPSSRQTASFHGKDGEIEVDGRVARAIRRVHHLRLSSLAPHRLALLPERPRRLELRSRQSGVDDERGCGPGGMSASDAAGSGALLEGPLARRTIERVALGEHLVVIDLLCSLELE